MKELIAHIDPSWLLLLGFALGTWWSDRRRTQTGQRIGQIEDAVAELRGALTSRLGRGSNGE